MRSGEKVVGRVSEVGKLRRGSHTYEPKVHPARTLRSSRKDVGGDKQRGHERQHRDHSFFRHFIHVSLVANDLRESSPVPANFPKPQVEIVRKCASRTLGLREATMPKACYSTMTERLSASEFLEPAG